jgi:hypothetical protein
MKLSKEMLNTIELVGVGELPQNELINLKFKDYNMLKFDMLLQSYLKDNDWKGFRILFWYLPNSLSEQEKEIIRRKYILEYSHFEHEEMIMGFRDRYFSKENIPVIVKLINNPPQYFYDEDREYVFIRKCIDALKSQKYPESFEAMLKLSETTKDETVKKMTTYWVKNWHIMNGQ